MIFSFIAFTITVLYIVFILDAMLYSVKDFPKSIRR